MLINDILKQKTKTVWIDKNIPDIEFTQNDVNKMITDNLKIDSLKNTQTFANSFEIKHFLTNNEENK